MVATVHYELPILAKAATARALVIEWLERRGSMILYVYPPAGQSGSAYELLSQNQGSSQNEQFNAYLPQIRPNTVWALYAEHGIDDGITRYTDPRVLKQIRIRCDQKYQVTNEKILELQKLVPFANTLASYETLDSLVIEANCPGAHPDAASAIWAGWWNGFFLPLYEKVYQGMELERKGVRVREPSRPTETPVKAVADPVVVEALTPLQSSINDLFCAYEDTPVFTLGALAEMVKAKPEEVRLAAAKLIRMGRLQGKLQGETLVRRHAVTIQCQLCDQSLANPVSYWQCSACKRYVCQTCQEARASRRCPNCGAEQHRLPLLCPKCSTILRDLTPVIGGRCPNCQTALF